MLCKMNSGVCETLKAMIHLPSTRSYDSFDHTHTHTHTPARVVFSVCDCFVTVCRDCVLYRFKLNMVLNLNIYRLDIES